MPDGKQLGQVGQAARTNWLPFAVGAQSALLVFIAVQIASLNKGKCNPMDLEPSKAQVDLELHPTRLLDLKF